MICHVIITDVGSGSGLPEDFSSSGVTLKSNLPHDFNLG